MGKLDVMHHAQRQHGEWTPTLETRLTHSTEVQCDQREEGEEVT